MTKQTILIGVGAVVLFALGAWFLRAPHAEAPAVAQNNTPVPQTTETTATTTTDRVATATPETSTPNTAPVVKTTPKPSPAPTPSYTLVTYDGQNFSPHKVSIAKGGTVRFLNVSSKDMWVASGVHPLHSEYPIHTQKDCAGSIFDECAAVEKGGHWDFKFDVEGTWDYHNHKSPISEGIVRVLLPGQH